MGRSSWSRAAPLLGSYIDLCTVRAHGRPVSDLSGRAGRQPAKRTPPAIEVGDYGLAKVTPRWSTFMVDFWLAGSMIVAKVVSTGTNEPPDPVTEAVQACGPLTVH